MWIEIFKTGKHKDSNGIIKEWKEDDLDYIAAKYDSTIHEAPVVIGHPTDSAPAYGWVEVMKREGSTLFAKLRDVIPEFIDLVKQKRYKKRSISLYPDMGLRHVGFLGAMPPSVKGLADTQFADEETITIDDPMNEDHHVTTYSEEEITALVERARAEGEGQGKTKERVESRKRESKRDEELRRIDIRRFVEAKVKDGVLPPCFVDAGIIEFMEALDGQSKVIEFGEGQEKKAGEWFMDFINSVGKFPIFTEIATKGRVADPRAHSEAQTGREIAATANS